MRKTIKWTKNPRRNAQKITTLTSNGEKFSQTVKQREDWCKKARRELMQNTTEEENIVYNKLPSKMKSASFQQFPFFIRGHIYFADIYIKKWKIVIEVDGGYHKNKYQVLKDKERDTLMGLMGIRVYRINNDDVRNATTLKEFIHMIKLLKRSYKEDVSKENKYLSNATAFQQYKDKRLAYKIDKGNNDGTPLASLT